jgi:hypothetical protein
MCKKIMGDIDFNRLSRNELYRLSTITVYAMRRLNRHLKRKESNMLDNKSTDYIDYNRLTRKELYQLCTTVVYAMRRLHKRLNEEEYTIKSKEQKLR